MRAAFPPARLLLSWLALLALLGLTVLAAYQPLGPLNLVVAIAIAVLKALVVGLVFMDLRDSFSLAWVFAGAGFLWLLILLGLASTDYLMRAQDPPG